LSCIRGEIAALEGDHGTAEESLRGAHEADPTDAFFAHDVAAVLAGGRRFDEALEVIDCTLATPVLAGRGPERARTILRQLREKIEGDRNSMGPARSRGGE
jgi:hypothetical protein